ncbi:hypothetical protein [Ascidiaceihabitans sp.]|uniref:hypothetical protein n=1 Tax=Ascidiaceihabitans sp. TaxID=1872644 RepID=UPI0032990981
MSNKWVGLVSVLLAKTQEGSLSWQETSDEDTFVVVVGSNAVEVEQGGFGDEFEFRIRDGNGRIVDKFNDVELTNISGNDYSDQLQQMFVLIKRQLSGTEKVLDDIISGLTGRIKF